MLRPSFIISTCVQSDLTRAVLRNNISSIRAFYESESVTVVVDNSNDDLIQTLRAEFRDDKNTHWIRNPFPKSGEFGTLYVATSVLYCDANEVVVFIHDSCCLRRRFTTAELESVGEFLPLWTAAPYFFAWFDHKLLKDHSCVPLLDLGVTDFWKREGLYEQGMAAVSHPTMHIIFGVMFAAKQSALQKIWNAGLCAVRPQDICTRLNRCRIERLFPVCAHIAGYSCVIEGRTLYGDILAHPGNFVNIHVAPDYKTLQTDDVRVPAVYKSWMGR